VSQSIDSPSAAYFGFERRDVTGFLPASYRNVLEIGCAEGHFSKHLPQAVEYWGIEPDPVAARSAESRIAHVLCGTFDACHSQIPDGKFDLVVCNDVIEHMNDHDWFLQNIQKKMTADALIVGSLPNVRYITNLVDLLVRKDWPYTNSGILDRTHLRFFTEKSLRRALTTNGFSVQELRGINSVFRRPQSLMDAAKVAVAGAAIVGTVGFAADVRFFQFAFRARRSAAPVNAP
jgi:2-polyprenyl-3-methyl-5-hydroxy-6-metoxy-1,4-benzoquinol methylase